MYKKATKERFSEALLANAKKDILANAYKCSGLEIARTPMVEWDKITAAAVAVIEKSSTSPPATRRSKRIRN